MIFLGLVGSAMLDCRAISLFPSGKLLSIFIRYSFLAEIHSSIMHSFFSCIGWGFCGIRCSYLFLILFVVLSEVWFNTINQ